MDGCPYPDYCPSSGGSAGNVSDSASCPMEMFFVSSQSVCVFLSSWHIHSSTQWVALVFGIFAMALCRELLIAHRQHRDRQRRLEVLEEAERKANVGVKGQRKSPPSPPTQSIAAAPLARPLMGEREEQEVEAPTTASDSLFSYLKGSDGLYGGLDGLYYALTLLLAYLLMLLVMTYNVTVILIVIVASTIAHVLVSLFFTAWWRRDTEQRKSRKALRSQRGGAGQAEGGNNAPPPYLLDDVAVTPQPTSDPCCADIDVDAFD